MTGLRPCTVWENDEPTECLFHLFTTETRIDRDVVIYETYAIVEELHTGKVTRVDPSQIVFHVS